MVVEVVVIDSDQIDAETRLRLRELWNLAFGDRFSDYDADHAYGGVHVLLATATGSSATPALSPDKSSSGTSPGALSVTSRPWLSILSVRGRA